MDQLSHLYLTTGKTMALTRWTFVFKVISLLFNMLSRLVIAFLQRSKHLLISWLQSQVHIDFGAQEYKLFHCFHFSPSICHEVMGPDPMIFAFWMLSLKLALSLYSFTFIKRLFSSSSLSAIRVATSASRRLLITSLGNLWIPAFRIHPAWHFAWCTLHGS